MHDVRNLPNETEAEILAHITTSHHSGSDEGPSPDIQTVPISPRCTNAESDSAPTRSLSCCDIAKIVAVTVFVVAMIILGFTLQEPLEYAMLKVFYFFATRKVEGVIIFSILYAGAVVIPLPIKTIVALAVGFFYGILLGFPVIYLSSTIGCLLGFLFGRYVFTDIMRKIWEAKLSNRWEGKTSAAMAHLLVNEPFKAVLCLRLTPVPMSWVNYICATSDISFKHYALATVVSRFLGTSNLNVVVGASLKTISDIANSDSSTVSVFLPSLIMASTLMVASITLAFFLTRKAQAWLAEREHDATDDVIHHTISADEEDTP